MIGVTSFSSSSEELYGDDSGADGAGVGLREVFDVTLPESRPFDLARSAPILYEITATAINIAAPMIKTRIPSPAQSHVFRFFVVGEIVVEERVVVGITSVGSLPLGTSGSPSNKQKLRLSSLNAWPHFGQTFIFFLRQR